jgi:hypothetical protein
LWCQGSRLRDAVGLCELCRWLKQPILSRNVGRDTYGTAIRATEFSVVICPMRADGS